MKCEFCARPAQLHVLIDDNMETEVCLDCANTLSAEVPVRVLDQV
jgi:protein-arginine kinase activator protein McsA